MQSIILGGGCFWCTESVFLAVKGVEQVVSGYAGGLAKTANYDAVCSGSTDHAEVVNIDYDEHQIGVEMLLAIFFTIHDPTTLNRQGNDIGAQYRSVVFYNTDEQKQAAHAMIKSLKSQGINVVTQVEPAPEFFPAEDYHQNFYAKNPTQGYCNALIPPKLAALKERYAEYLK